MKPGKATGSWSVDAQTYIDECNRERLLMRSIEVQSDARPLSWGKIVEKPAFNKIGIEYTLCSHLTIQHPEIDYWCGSPDATTAEAVADLKCPMTLTSFCQMVDPYKGKDESFDGLTIEAVRKNHKDGDKFFWQIVSNAILTNKKKGQLIVFVPYLEELDEIRRLADGDPKLYWLQFSDDEGLPYLIKGGHYKNINVIEFDILDRDKNALTDRIIECGKQLIPRP
jgi:hypothetical protein